MPTQGCKYGSECGLFADCECGCCIEAHDCECDDDEYTGDDPGDETDYDEWPDEE